MTLVRIDVAHAAVYFDGIVAEATLRGCSEAALIYYRALASLLRDPETRAWKLNPKTKTGTSGLPLSDLLDHEKEWLAAAQTYIDTMTAASGSVALG